ncbi:hypothetical protein FRC12_002815 [Ceratobasidium sp. 428]|nr:hypothetical protein FRC12_002815 [Ceratobasidium sp. 428]
MEDSDHIMETAVGLVGLDEATAASAATRRGKSKRSNKQGNLASIVTVPLDVFTEIASYLYPLDILFLARTTKYFRKLLMHQSAQHIWHAAERNVPGLPEGPPHMSEPAYIAMIFIKGCTYCGTTINIPKIPDPELYVRLCSSCADLNVLAYHHVPTAVQAYVPTSGYIKPRATHNDTFCLRSDVNSVTDRLIELAWAGDHITEGRWKAERREELGNRRTHSKLLREYLVAVEANREDDLEELKERRLAAIRVRLIQNGWDEVDTQVIHPPLMRAWRQLVWQAKPLTDRIWNNLYPKLKPILEANKQQRLIREREHRRTTSHAQILGFLSNLKENECPYIELTAGSDGSALGSFERVRLPFPSIESIRKLSFLGTLWIEDITAEDTLTSLTSWRPKLEKAILSWRGGLERELVEKLTRGEFQLAFDSFTPSKQPLLKNSKKQHLWEPETITPSTASFTPDSEQYIHRNTKVLLRADSIFVISESDSVYFYPEAIDELEKKLADNPESRYKRKQNYGYDYEPNTIEQLDTSLLHIHYQAQEVARELLDRLGRPNATYLETKAIGQRFVCARCWNGKPMIWAEIVDHYVTGYHAHRTRSRFYQREGLQITSVNIHDLGEKEEVGDSMQVDGDETLNASKIAEQTPIEIVTVEDASSLLSTQLVPQLFGCQLCSLVPERFGEMGELPKGSKEVMEKHLTQEHPGTPEHTLKDGLYSV